MEGEASVRFCAAFFDRDQTLLYADPALRAERNARIEAWSGKPFTLTPAEMMELFFASRPPQGVKSVEDEVASLRLYWKSLLLRAGVSEGLEERGEELHQMTWLKGLKLFPETLEVLQHLRGRGMRMGVISDTSPSLPLTLEAAGIGAYFACAVCSDLVGVMKPAPQMYQTALDALGVAAGESLYVDDCGAEAEGARRLGFTAFHIDRSRPGDSRWRIQSLRAMVAYLQDIG